MPAAAPRTGNVGEVALDGHRRVRVTLVDGPGGPAVRLEALTRETGAEEWAEAGGAVEVGVGEVHALTFLLDRAALAAQGKHLSRT